MPLWEPDYRQPRARSRPTCAACKKDNLVLSAESVGKKCPRDSSSVAPVSTGGRKCTPLVTRLSLRAATWARRVLGKLHGFSQDDLLTRRFRSCRTRSLFEGPTPYVGRHDGLAVLDEGLVAWEPVGHRSRRNRRDGADQWSGLDRKRSTSDSSSTTRRLEPCRMVEWECHGRCTTATPANRHRILRDKSSGSVGH